MKKNTVRKGLFMSLNYRMQSINRENVTSVKQQDIPTDIVNGVLVYTYRVFLILGHQEIK